MSSCPDTRRGAIVKIQIHRLRASDEILSMGRHHKLPRTSEFAECLIRPLDPRFFEREEQYPSARRTCCGTSSRSSASGFHVAGAGSTAGASASVVILREKQADSEPQSGSAAATGAPPLLPPGPTLNLSRHHSSCSLENFHESVVCFLMELRIHFAGAYTCRFMAVLLRSFSNSKIVLPHNKRPPSVTTPPMEGATARAPARATAKATARATARATPLC